MKRIIISLLLFIMVFCCGCHTEQNPDTTTPIMPTEQTDTGQQEETMAVTMPEEVVYEGIPVETPCGTLYIPDEWDIPISVAETQGDPLVITFKAEDVELYELTFSGKAHNAIGEVRTEDGIIYVGMNIRALEDETDMLMAMQESVNVLLTQLALEPVNKQAQRAHARLKHKTCQRRKLYLEHRNAIIQGIRGFWVKVVSFGVVLVIFFCCCCCC